MPPFRIVRPFVAILRAERYPYTSHTLKRGAGPRMGNVGQKLSITAPVGVPEGDKGSPESPI